MSILLNDTEVTNQKKRSPLDGIQPAPLRDQLLKKLANKLANKNIGTKVKDLWHGGNSNRQELLQRQQDYLAEWDEFLVPHTEGAFAGSSQLHLPFPLIVAKGYHARFMQALLTDPSFVAKPRTEASMDRAELVQETMGYAIKDWANFNRGVTQVVDQWVWQWITNGSATMKLRWECKYEKFIDVALVPKPGPVQKRIDPETGEEVEIPTVVAAEEEVEKMHKWEGPVVECIPFEDLLIIGGKGDPQLADVVIHRSRLTASELWTLADRKIFDKEAVEKIVKGGQDYATGEGNSTIKHMRAEYAGMASADSEYDLDRYEILEAYLPFDVDGSGINTEIIVWVHARSGELCRATYLRRVHKSGERPFAKIDFHIRPESDYGVGLIEMIYPLAKELDALHNIRVDAGIIANMPFGFYRPSSSLDPVKLELSPGALIPLDNPREDVNMVTFSNKTAWGFQEEQSIQTWTERLTGMNDMSMGVMTGAQGATRTASGARILAAEGNTNLDVFLRRLNSGWKVFLELLLHALQQRIPAGLAFRVTGQSGNDYFAQIRNSDDLGGDYDIVIEPNSSNSNKQIQQELATQIVQATSNPLDIQLGIITPAQRYEALKNWYKQNGVKEFNKYLQKPPQYSYVPTPAEEVDRIMRGIQVPVMPNSDHEGYLALWEEYKGSDELLGQMNQEQSIACEMQARQHMQMMAALQQMAAQQQNRQQMRMNAAESQQQAPPAMNPMAGSENA